MTPSLFIGVDGGATHCRARIRDADGVCLGEGSAGPANVWLDLPGATANILAACRAAAGAAGLGREELGRLHAGFGLAGLVSAEVKRAFRAQPLPFASVVADNDAYAACLGAHGGKDGAILIVGTGSCGLAVVDGVRTNVGGWGQVISDHASGGRLGRAALRQALWAPEGVGTMTALCDALLTPHGHDASRTAEWAKTATPADFAALVPLIFEHAHRLDPVAMQLVRKTAADAECMIERLLAAGAPRVSLVGGMAEALAPWLSAPLRERLSLPQGDAVDGAIFMAQQAVADARAGTTKP